MNKPTGEQNLSVLLSSMRPVVDANDYVFCTFKSGDYGDFCEYKPVAAIMEAEGLTLVIPLCIAESKKLEVDAIFKRITLTVHSSLEAVGLTAAISKELAIHAISANVIAGYFHDHVFVQSEYADKAMQALMTLADRGE